MRLFVIDAKFQLYFFIDFRSHFGSFYFSGVHRVASLLLALCLVVLLVASASSGGE